MILNNLSTGKPDATVSLPLDENKWKAMPFAPWSTVNAFYRKMLYIQKPDTLATPQDMYMNGYAILHFVYFDDSREDTIYSFFFDDIFNDDWIVGPNKDGIGGILAMEPIDLFNKRDSFQKSITESKLKRKLEETNEALSQLQEKTVKLETNLESKEQELTSVGKALADQKRTHQDYIRSKASEVKKLRQTHNETEKRLKESAAASGQGGGPTFYEFMLRFVTDMQKSLKTKLDNISDNAQKKFMSTCKVNVTDPDKIIAFRFQDHHNQWTVVDDNVFQLLIVSYENKVQTTIKYKAYGQSYETTLKLNTHNVHGNSEFVFEQVNVATKAHRFLEPVSRADEATSISAAGYDLNPKDFTRMQMDELLFGDSHFAVDLKAEVEFVNYMSLINNDKPDSATLNHSYKETTDPFILKLSELVQLHSSMATGYKYLSPNGKKSKSALIIQPDVIRAAFRKAAQESAFKKNAHERYDYMRLIFHGSPDYTSWLTNTFSFAEAGKNGEALGPGFYLAMSDEVATLYSSFKPIHSGAPRHGFRKGSMMASLCFTPKSPTKFKNNGKLVDQRPLNYPNFTHKFDGNISTKYLSVDTQKHLEHHNAIVFNDPTLVIPIGVMVPWN